MMRTAGFARIPVLRKLSVRSTERAYKKSLGSLATQPEPRHTDLAVVIHLYYTDNWDYFRQKLAVLANTPFDLYLTLPAQNAGFVDTVRRTHPEVRYVVAPNRGRDVLPFIMVAKQLRATGYKAVLKFHSKKSLHWDGGDDWLHETMAALLPDKKQSIHAIIEKLNQPETAVLGTAQFYYPLTINFPANGPHLTKILTRIYGSEVAQSALQADRRKYGFFAGTMFWCRLDAIEKILDVATIRDFEAEAGQIDGTFAHALERLFCVVPEIEGRSLYELDGYSVKKRVYASANIPEWSEDHDK
ncbi:hypothetical protein EYC59_00500 [Candidatus Saccharibacteria bacterium]|nr:MAG: hypothetical protein EYC59_00500 [Candidatus Saccharibacteria bacterium]